MSLFFPSQVVACLAGLFLLQGNVVGAAESILGRATPGVANTTQQVLERVSQGSLGSGETMPNFVLVDPTSGLHYYGINSFSTGRFVKVDPRPGATAPNRIGGLVLESGEYYIKTGVIDPEAGVAYLATDRNPNTAVNNRIIKVALNGPTEAPTRLAHLEIPGDEGGIQVSAIDTVNQYAYFGGAPQSGTRRIHKIDISGESPTYVGKMDLPGFPHLSSMIYNQHDGFLYCIGTNSGVLHRIDPGEGDALPTIVNSGNLSYGYASMVLDHDGTVLYGIDADGNAFDKVWIGDPSASPSRVGSVTVRASYGYDLWHDRISNRVYCATFDTLTAVDPGALPHDPPALVAELPLLAGNEFKFTTITGNEQDGIVIVGTDTGPSNIVKFAANTGMESPASMTAGYFGRSETTPLGGVLDEAAGLLYTTNQGSLIIWDIDVPGDPVRTASLTFAGDLYAGGLIAGDPSTGYVYVAYSSFSPVRSPRIFKFSVSGERGDPPVHVATGIFEGLPTNTSLSNFSHEPVNDVFYFTCGTNRTLAKVAPGVGDAPPHLLGTLEVTDANNGIRSIVYSEDGRHALAGLGSSPVRVEKLFLGGREDTMEALGSHEIGSASIQLTHAATDPATGSAWFVYPGHSNIYRLGFGSGPTPEYHGNSILNYGDVRSIHNIAYDPRNNQLLGIVSRFGEPTGLARIDVATTSTAFTLLSVTDIPDDQGSPSTRSLVIDDTRDRLYRIVTNLNPGTFEVLDLNGPTGTPTLAGKATSNLVSNDANMRLPFHDKSRGHALFALSGMLVKMAIPDGVAAPGKVAEMPLPSETSWLVDGAYDETSGHAYYITHPTVGTNPPFRLLKVAMGKGSEPPAIVASVDFQPGERAAMSIQLDTANRYGYVLCNPGSSSQGIIVKFRLGEGDDAPVRVGAVQTGSGNTSAHSLLLNEAGYLFAYVRTNPDRLVKFTAGTGDDLPSHLGELTFPSGERNMHSIVRDPANNQAYFFYNAYTVKVNLGAGNALPTRIGSSLTMTANMESPIKDSAYNRIWYRNATTGNHQPTIGYLTIGAGSTLAARGKNFMLLPHGPLSSVTHFLDAADGYLYAASNGTPATLTKLRLGNAHVIKGHRVTLTTGADVSTLRLYSHAAEGSVTPAIYTGENPPVLLWQGSPTTNTVAGGWINFPISEGMPSDLVLDPGMYYLGWHTDTNSRTMSYARGLKGDGILLQHPYSTLPATLDGATITSEQWAIHALYTPLTPSISVASGSVDFGSRHIDHGPGTPLDLTVSNNGSFPLEITGVSISGEEAASFSTTFPTPVVIPQGEHLDIPVTFNPAVVGYHSATLSIVSNDPESPTTLVDLNGIGTSDTQPEPHIAVLEVDGAPGEFIEFTAPTGTTLRHVAINTTTVPAGLPDGIQFPFGLFSFEIHGLTPGGAATVVIELPRVEPVTTYYRFGPLASNPTDHWYAFNIEGGTGATISGTTITLNYIDGGRGDDDLTPNGVVVDPGGPAIVTTGVSGWGDLHD